VKLNKATYGMNRYCGVGNSGYVRKPGDSKTPSSNFLAGEGHFISSGPYWAQPLDETSSRPDMVHAASANLLFLDGHAASLRDMEIPYTAYANVEGKNFWRGGK
jgi:prepilin-type processing-associated H-X9-DG protein